MTKNKYFSFTKRKIKFSYFIKIKNIFNPISVLSHAIWPYLKYLHI